VVELPAVHALRDAGTIVVACGGGGIPVAPRDGRLKGVDAVIVKDPASATIPTDVPAAIRDLGGAEEEIRKLAAAEARAGIETLVLSAASIGEALAGRAGTRIRPQ